METDGEQEDWVAGLALVKDALGFIVPYPVGGFE